MEILRPHKLVSIFNNAIENPQEVFDFFENNFEWESWYTFGDMLNISSGSHLFEKFPDKDFWNEKIYQPDLYKVNGEKEIIKRILNSFYKTTKIFFEETKLNSDGINFANYSIAKYVASPEARMNFHTDYKQERYKIPGDNMYVTAVFYLNDDYDGGEISFIELDNNQDIIWNYKYKPKAGDILVFSSMPPIYHGVDTVKQGNKYIIRTYWGKMYEPTDEWKKGIEEYGKEQWTQMKEIEAKRMQTEMINKKIGDDFISIQYIKVKDN